MTYQRTLGLSLFLGEMMIRAECVLDFWRFLNIHSDIFPRLQNRHYGINCANKQYVPWRSWYWRLIITFCCDSKEQRFKRCLKKASWRDTWGGCKGSVKHRSSSGWREEPQGWSNGVGCHPCTEWPAKEIISLLACINYTKRWSSYDIPDKLIL